MLDGFQSIGNNIDNEIFLMSVKMVLSIRHIDRFQSFWNYLQIGNRAIFNTWAPQSGDYRWYHRFYLELIFSLYFTKVSILNCITLRSFTSLWTLFKGTTNTNCHYWKKIIYKNVSLWFGNKMWKKILILFIISFVLCMDFSGK